MNPEELLKKQEEDKATNRRICDAVEAALKAEGMGERFGIPYIVLAQGMMMGMAATLSVVTIDRNIWQNQAKQQAAKEKAEDGSKQ